MPEPATPSKNAKPKGKGNLSLPYTFMYVSGLKLGLTTGDLRRMPYKQLTYMLQAWNEANEPSEEKCDVNVIEATQAHIDAILG